LPHEQHRADRSAVALGDPAALPPGIVVAPELRDDLGDQRLEPGIEAVLIGIQDAVAMHDPAEIAGLLRAQEVRRPQGGPGPEQGLDRAHGVEQAAPCTLRHGPDHRADLILRRLLETAELGPAVRGRARRFWRPSAIEVRLSIRPPRSKPRRMRLR
jgi:hypothetical protein